MPEIPPVIPGEFIFDTWGNPVARRTIQRYSDAADLATLNPTPETGDLSFLSDTQRIYVWDGVRWLEQFTVLGGGFVGEVRLSAGSTPSLASAYQVMVWDKSNGTLSRSALNEDIIPLSGGNTGDARFAAAVDMVTLSWQINGDSLASTVGTVPEPYRPLRDYYFTCGIYNSSGVAQSLWYTGRIRPTGNLELSGGDSPPAGGTLRGSVAYPWNP